MSLDAVCSHFGGTVNSSKVCNCYVQFLFIMNWSFFAFTASVAGKHCHIKCNHDFQELRTVSVELRM